MTESSCLPDGHARIDLWRKAVYLFHETGRPAWRGPFFAAGYREYRVGPHVLDAGGGEHRPDIVASTEANWIVLELTNNPKSKAPTLERYRRISSKTLRNHGLAPPDQEPDVLVGRPAAVPDGNFPQLILGSSLAVEGLHHVRDEKLRSELQSAAGSAFDNLPEIAFTMVPETSASFEIRAALLPIVMQLFSGRHAMSAGEMVDESLERLSDVCSNQDKRVLIEKVRVEMGSLIEGSRAPLAADIEHIDGKYRAKRQIHPNSMERLTKALKEWTLKDTRLTDFPSS